VQARKLFQAKGHFPTFQTQPSRASVESLKRLRLDKRVNRLSQMKIHLINLDRSQDRLSEFRRNNEHLKNVERYSAVDGSTLDVAALIANGAIDAISTKVYTPGSLGNALSHRALWAKAIGSNESVTVCEDDAIFNFDFERLAEAFIATLTPDWDFIAWGWNFDAPLMIDLLPRVSPCLAQFSQDRMRAGAKNFQKLSILPQPFRLFACLGTICYSVSPRGARSLTAACFPLKSAYISYPGIQHKWAISAIDATLSTVYDKINAYAAFPPLVITKNELSKSTVQTKALIPNKRS
jgi:glycosyl transferase family 25